MKTKIGVILWDFEIGEAFIEFNDELDAMNATELLDLAEGLKATVDGIGNEGWRQTGANPK